MTTHTNRFTLVPLAALMASISAQTLAQEGMEEVNRLRTPASDLAIGLSYSSDDLHQLGRYNGRDDDGFYGLLDFDINMREEETGTWTRVDGRSVGFSDRTLRYERNRQGDWKYYIQFDQLDSVNPYTFETQLTGIGTNSQTALGGPVTTRRLSQERKDVELGMSKYVGDWSQVSLRYRQDNKDGDRPWGANFTKFIVEPIDYRTQELEATYDYTEKDLQLRAGYLFSMFDNPVQFVSLDIEPDDTATPPDNESHSLYLSGGYNLSEMTRGTFKVSWTRDTQDEAFFAVNTSTPSRTSLDGKVDTTRISLGLVSRLSPQTTLKAKLRYDDRDDKTPQDIFYSSELNQLTSRTTTNGTVEAVYRAEPGLAYTAGVDHERWKRITTDNPNMAKRSKTNETTLRVGARKSLSATLNGSVRLSHAQRGGSPFIPGAAAPDIFVNPIQWADRYRDAFRGTLDWYPTDELSLQFVAEGSFDRYSGAPLGPRKGNYGLLSVDAGYQLNDEWSLNGWASVNETKLKQATQQVDHGDPTDFLKWGINGKDRGYAYGLGLKGQPDEETRVGMKLQVSWDQSRFPLYLIEVGPGATASELGSDLPHVTYRQTQLAFYGERDLDEHQGVRVDYQYNRVTNNDWLWNSFGAYSGTTVVQDSSENDNFVGVSYYYRGW